MKPLITFILLLVSTQLFAQEKIITPEKKKQILEYINHFESNDQLMGNISIYENGKELINKTLGAKNKTANTRYTVGSITKMFTAVLFAQLEEANKLNLDNKLSNYFPQVPNASKISIRQMLNHTSGLQGYVVKEDSIYTWLNEPVTQKDILNEIIRQGVTFQPGDSMNYSNGAYYLLARILEQTYKMKYSKILHAYIIEPLSLEHTFSLDAENNKQNPAKSYEKRKGKWVEMVEFYFPNASGVGGIVSTASDLNIFVQELFSGRLIKLVTLNKMLPAKNDWFGLGIMKVPFYKQIAYGHGGDTHGTHSVMSYNTKNTLAISYIINGENYPTNDFAIGLLSTIYDKDFILPSFKEYKPENRFLKLYEGTYGAKEFPMDIKIFLEDNQLKAQGKGQKAFKLTPTEKHIFVYRKAGIEIEFKPFENQFILKQRGQKITLKKQ